MNNIYNEALKYIERGWHIFPLHSVVNGKCTCGADKCTDAGKHPRVKKGVKEASIDPVQIEQWFGESAPMSNIGLATGKISGITVIDIDIGDGKLGAENWHETVKEEGEPLTLYARTGSGGLHVFFAYNSVLKTASNVFGKGVDTRNDNGYVVAAPSMHRSGQRYEWIDYDVEIEALPACLSRRKETRGRPRKDDMFKGKYTIEQVRHMLEFVPADDRDMWRNVGVILGREFKRVEEAWDVYVEWSEKGASSKKSRNHDNIMHQAFYEISEQQSETKLSLGTIVKYAIENGWSPKNGEVPSGNFLYFAPQNNYIYRPTSSYWVASGVNAAVSEINDGGRLMPASQWLKQNQLVTSMTKDPSLEDDYIKGYDCREGEIIKSTGAALYNAYRHPTIELGDARLAQPFINHVNNVFSKDGDAEQFLCYMAHRVQKPWEKPRFALLIAGGQGVGKDTAIEFCCPSIGAWNVSNIDPSAFESQFNEYAAATLVRINEAANLHEMSKWAFNERTKVLIAGQPDTCQINPKYGQKYSVRMFCGVIITTNHLLGGIYIPPDDRRYDVIESSTIKDMNLVDDFARKQYFTELWAWFYDGGANHIAAYLNEKDISHWSASNGQRKTVAHSAVVSGGLHADGWLDDIIDELNYPNAIRSDIILQKAVANGEKEIYVKRKLNNAMQRLNYRMFKSERPDGRWKIGKKLYVVYAKECTPHDYDPTVELSEEVF